MNTYDPLTRTFLVNETCTASALEAETKQKITAKDTIVYAAGKVIIPDKPIMARVMSAQHALWEKNPPPPEPPKEMTLVEELEAAGISAPLVEKVKAALAVKEVPLGK